MATKRYQFSGSTADGDTLSPAMSYTQERGYVAFTFYSDSDLTTIATPTAGILTSTISENGEIYGSISDGTTTASDVGPAVTYIRPNWSGSARRLKLNLAGVTGAAFFKCVISRFGA